MSNNSARPLNPHIKQIGAALSSLKSVVIACLRSVPMRGRIGLRIGCAQGRDCCQAEAICEGDTMLILRLLRLYFATARCDRAELVYMVGASYLATEYSKNEGDCNEWRK